MENSPSNSKVIKTPDVFFKTGGIVYMPHLDGWSVHGPLEETDCRKSQQV